MARKLDIKQAAVEGASTLETIIKRPDTKPAIPQYSQPNTTQTLTAQSTQDAPAAQDVPDVQNAKNKGGRPRKSAEPMERLSLKIPVSIKEYLTVAAARESIASRKKVSPTDYLCGLIRADMEQHKDD